MHRHYSDSFRNINNNCSERSAAEVKSWQLIIQPNMTKSSPQRSGCATIPQENAGESRPNAYPRNGSSGENYQLSFGNRQHRAHISHPNYIAKDNVNINHKQKVNNDPAIQCRLLMQINKKER